MINTKQVRANRAVSAVNYFTYNMALLKFEPGSFDYVHVYACLWALLSWQNEDRATNSIEQDTSEFGIVSLK